MIKKIGVGALLAGLVVFVWQFISHVVLPLGEVGISGLPAEETLLESFRENLPEAGLYIFPGQLDDDMATLQEKYAKGPVGLLSYRPGAGEAMEPAQLGRQLVLDFLGGVVLIWLLIRANATLSTAIGFGIALGLFALLTTSAAHWNWYSFPLSYTLAEGADVIIGWALGGAVAGWWLNRGTCSPQTGDG